MKEARFANDSIVINFLKRQLNFSEQSNLAMLFSDDRKK